MRFKGLCILALLLSFVSCSKDKKPEASVVDVSEPGRVNELEPKSTENEVVEPKNSEVAKGFTLNEFGCPEEITGSYECKVKDYLQPEGQQEYTQSYELSLKGKTLLISEEGDEESVVVVLDGERRWEDGTKNWKSLILGNIRAQCVDGKIEAKVWFPGFGANKVTMTLTEKGYNSIDVDEDGEVEVEEICERI